MTEPESAERPDDLAPVPRYRWVSPGRLLWLGLAAVAGLTLALNFGELRSIAGTARRAEWEWLVATAGVEVLFVINLALFYSSTFRASGIPTHPARFVLLTSASHFVNLVAKTGGLAGVALYLREGERSAVSSARISAAYMVAYVLGYLAYVSVLVLALVLLYVRGNLNRAEVVAAAIILGIVFIIAGAMVLGLRSETPSDAAVA